MRKIVDGNTAASEMAYLFTEVATIYPITPSSPMASNVDKLNETEIINLFNDKVLVSELESEAGASGSLHGALLSGSLATTFTASQGLLLMIPNMYKIAGECLPGVIHVASRTVATHALSIFGDHSDIYATRSTGFCMLASSSVKDAYNLAAVAHLSAIKGSLPFLHFFDGFRTSHEINTINTLNREDLIKLVDKDKLKEFKNRSINLGRCYQHGMSETEDVYFQSMEARTPLYDAIPDIVNNYMESINGLANTTYKPFNYYGDKDAENIIIAMGSVCDTIRNVIKEEQKKNHKLGMIEVHLYRPFSKEYLLNVLPKSVKNIAVLDRTKEMGSKGPLYLDVIDVLKDKDVNIVGGRYGLSSKNTTPEDIYSIYNMLETNIKDNFTIGIIDDLNNTSLPIIPYKIDHDDYEIRIYGYGSDGMVSASKDILKIIGEKEYVQGYFEYDSKKSGGVTVSHLRLSKEEITSPYYVENADLICVSKEEYFKKYELLSEAKEESILLVNTNDIKKWLESISKEDMDSIINKKIKCYAVDASTIARTNNIPGKISKIMETVILYLLNKKEQINELKESTKTKFKTKGEDIVNNNLKAIDESLKELQIVKIMSPGKNKKLPKTNDIEYRMTHRLGNSITTSEINDYKDGTFKGEYTKTEKRNIAEKVSKWIPEKCVECGMCSLVCPHGCIRPFIVENNIGKEAIGVKDKYFYLAISEADCTGCGLCTKVCPTKSLEMGEYDNNSQEEANKLFNIENPENPFDKFTVKGSQFERPRFEFSGACAGCGETAYIKLFTQLYGKELIIANATGCSSIYGGSAPSTPYSIPWANSLFEDNAEFAYGMHLSFKNRRQRLVKIIGEEAKTSEGKLKELYEEFLNNTNNYEITNRIATELSKESIPESIKELLPDMAKRTILAIGGDGWAYDIGFGGIDHVLSSEENIKVLVLDTEAYSNTGGQMSKSTHIGAVAEFANFGKRSHKKDLFRIAMSYPNCYVASISLGANPMQSIKAIKEAMEHEGPAIIIAYAPCIEHGIKGGMSCSTERQKLSVEVGYNILMRYNPEEDKLYIDSKEPDFTKYNEFLNGEVRYNALAIKDPKLASILAEEDAKSSKERYDYYKKIVNKE